jgi:SAM-dependent methyltransferase
MNQTNQRTLLHLGCGPFVEPTRWIDCDGSWNARVNSWPKPLASLLRSIAKKAGGGQRPLPGHIRYFDLRKRFPFDDESVDAIYAAHVWEHLALSTAKHATEECYRVLKPGGALRLIVPNVRDAVEEYLHSNVPDAALTLNRRLYYRPFEECRSLIYSIYLGFTDFHYHRFMYDPPQLISLLQASGFVCVSEKNLLESQIEEIGDVESETRIGRNKGFVVEGLKRDGALA